MSSEELPSAGNHASISPNSSIGNGPDGVDKNHDFVNANAQATLLEALQNLVVRMAEPKGKISDDIDQISLGHEAGKFIMALQELISSLIVHSQWGKQKAIEISLVEDENTQEFHGQFENNDVEDNDLFEETPSSDPNNTRGDCSNDQDTSDGSLATFPQKLLKGLREHIFNKMPIRLLSLEPYGNHLRITLLERGVIYARLASFLQGNINEDHSGHSLRCATETDQQAIERLINKYTRYAILSHTWLRTGRGEVTYSDWNEGLFDKEDAGYQKLINFGKTAWKEHGLTFAWMDTVCINKDSSSELDESIRSMYNWYSRSSVCITYLAGTGMLSDMHRDPWFTRGWTLQELLAPDAIKFYNRNWKQLIGRSVNDKTDTEIVKQIEKATTISARELQDIHRASISRRMQLAATREVMREEDTAYSLMGIFNVSFSTAYGEGAERAFFRLLQEILVSSDNVLDLFNWAGVLPDIRPHKSALLPLSPQHYLNRSSSYLKLKEPIKPLILTHLGLRVPVILMPGISIQGTPFIYEPIGDFSATVAISPVSNGYSGIPTTFNLLDHRIYSPNGRRQDNARKWTSQLTFAVFNFGGDNNTIWIRSTCVAKVLHCIDDAGKVSVLPGNASTINTEAPTVFELRSRANVPYSALAYLIGRDELARHGMQLISLYL